jgi:lipoprotein-anchoring transpeptidase ErfK/SrfK
LTKNIAACSSGTLSGNATAFEVLDGENLAKLDPPVERTPTGTFKVQRKINGWRLSSLGLLYYPSYIVNGIAIHGSLSIPAFPASHGCIRIPMFAAKEMSEMTPVGTVVAIYDR